MLTGDLLHSKGLFEATSRPLALWEYTYITKGVT